MAELVALPYPRGTSTLYSNRLNDFSGANPRCYEDVFVTSFFLAQVDSGSICLKKTFLWPTDLNAFNSTIYRHLLSFGSL